MKDLPSEMLEKIASVAADRDEMKGMRGVCSELKTAFEATVTIICMQTSKQPEPVYSPLRMRERYPLLQR